MRGMSERLWVFKETRPQIDGRSKIKSTAFPKDSIEPVTRAEASGTATSGPAADRVSGGAPQLPGHPSRGGEKKLLELLSQCPVLGYLEACGSFREMESALETGKDPGFGVN